MREQLFLQKQYPLAKEITTPDGFINVNTISIGELVGKKVVLVDFWTYSCINCQRTIPYLNAWYEKYKDKGLVIVGVDSSAPRNPEIYFGAERNSHLGNGKANTAGLQNLSEPAHVETNALYLSGSWDFQDEFAENKSSEAKILFRYQAQDVYMVASSEKGIKVKILLDGKPQSTLFIKEDGLYKIIQDPGGWGEHTLEFIIETPGLRVFTFTFG